MRKFRLQQLAIISLIWFMATGWLMLFTIKPQTAVVAGNNHGLIRLHILANSDSSTDQQLKLLVKDAIVNYLTPRLEGLADSAAAREFIRSHRHEIIAVAKEIIAQNGADYPVSIQMGLFDFPIKAYGNLVLPAGRYEAVRILIGQGSGKNWWCVLFPPLCFVDGTNAVAIPRADNDANAYRPGKATTIEFRSKLWELIQNSNVRFPKINKIL